MKKEIDGPLDTLLGVSEAIYKALKEHPELGEWFLENDSFPHIGDWACVVNSAARTIRRRTAPLYAATKGLTTAQLEALVAIGGVRRLVNEPRAMEWIKLIPPLGDTRFFCPCCFCSPETGHPNLCSLSIALAPFQENKDG